MEELRNALREHLAPRRHSFLLAVLVALFAARPLTGDTGMGVALFSTALVLLLLLALYNINVDELVGERGRLLAQGRRRRIYGWVLAMTAATERVAAIFVHSWMMNLATSVCWLLFVSFVTLSQLRSVLKQREVTSETICMAVSVYLLLGLTWTFVYGVIFQMHPESFAGFVVVKSATELRHIFPILGYFSLTTLSTIGFGDITPLTLQVACWSMHTPHELASRGIVLFRRDANTPASDSHRKTSPSKMLIPAVSATAEFNRHLDKLLKHIPRVLGYLGREPVPPRRSALLHNLAAVRSRL
jgi:hypothetical protein